MKGGGEEGWKREKNRAMPWTNKTGKLHEKQAVASRCTWSRFPAILQPLSLLPAKNAKMADTRVREKGKRKEDRKRCRNKCAESDVKGCALSFSLSPALYLPLCRPIIFIDCIYKLEIRLINA